MMQPPLTFLMCQCGSAMIHNRLDLAKNVSQVHEADGTGRAVVAISYSGHRSWYLATKCGVAIVACSDARLWGREIGKRGSNGAGACHMPERHPTGRSKWIAR
ncbi:MAG: hypothetical protein ACI9IV_001607 [Paracoccaceae bacterium]|jgi:hypothetical protein